MTAGSRRGAVWSLVIAAGCMDLTSYLFFYTCSVVAQQAHGFSAVGTLLMGTWFDVVYSAACTLTAGKSEGRSRRRFLLVGGGLVVAAGAGAAVAPVIGTLLAAIAVKGFALSQWWPNLQARLGDLAGDADALQHNLGLFNLGWCTGKGVGLVLAAALVAAGPSIAFGTGCLLAAGAVAAATRSGSEPGGAPAAGGPTRGDRAPGYLVAGRLANFVWWGIGILCVWAMAARAAELRLGAGVGGVVLAGIFLSQAAASAVLWRTRGWRYRLEPLLGLQCVGVLGLAGFTLGTSVAAFALSAVACGVALGMAYYASIFYSLDAPVARAHTSARHEAVLAAGGACVPLAGAGLAAWFGSGAAPFAFAAVLSLAVLPLQAWCVRGLRPPGPAGA